MKGFCKIFSALIVITALISVPGCVFNNLDVENAQNVLNDAVNDNNGIRGTVKITGMNDVSDCLVIVEKQIDGIKTATVFNTLYRSSVGSDFVAEDIYILKTDKYGMFEATGLSDGKYTITVKKADTLGAVVKDIVVKNERAIVDLDIVLTATGRLTGNVKLSDMTTDMFGSFVYAEGTSYIAATDGTGDFCIKDIPVGTYNIIFFHEGYSTYRKVGVTITAAVDNALEGVDLSKLSSSVYLSNLTISGAALSPAFNKSITYYDVTVDTTIDTVNFTPYLEDSTSQVQINGIYCSSSVVSGEFEIVYGRNIFSIDVINKNGDIRNYIVAIVKYNLNLIGFTISNGTISPQFSSDTTVYYVSVPRSNDNINVTPISESNNSTIQININGGLYEYVNSGSQSKDFPLTNNTNLMNIRVTAFDNITYKVYNIYIIKSVTGVVSHLAGGIGGPGSMDGIGAAAEFFGPRGITTDGTNLFVCDNSNSMIRKIVIST